MIAVIDTNVFIAALLNPSGAPAKIRRRWQRRQFRTLISEAVLEEYADVLTHAPVIAANVAQFLIEEIEAFSRRIEISGALQVCKDRDDDMFLETAVAGGADFLVTKNLKHFPYKSYESVRIVNVATFLKELEKIFPA